MAIRYVVSRCKALYLILHTHTQIHTHHARHLLRRESIHLNYKHKHKYLHIRIPHRSQSDPNPECPIIYECVSKLTCMHTHTNTQTHACTHTCIHDLGQPYVPAFFGTTATLQATPSRLRQFCRLPTHHVAADNYCAYVTYCIIACYHTHISSSHLYLR